MKLKIKFIINILVLVLYSCTTVYANNLDNIIENTPALKNAIVSVSVKDTKTQKTIYEYNQNKFMNPASVLKVFTTRTAYSELGTNFVFKTKTFADDAGNLYIELSGDPTFSEGQLKSLLDETTKILGSQINDIILVSNNQDNKQWGIGWMWDDDVSALLPKYSPYSINGNLINVTITPGTNGKNPTIKNNSCYDLVIINNLKNGSRNDVTLERSPWRTSDLTIFNGNVKSKFQMRLPVDNPEKHFKCTLLKTLNSLGIKHNGEIKIAPLPQNVKEIFTVSSEPIEKILSDTLKYSDNFYSEMIFRKAGESYSKSIASTENAIKLFDKYYSDIESEKPFIVDACGISRNNLISTDWMTSALNKIAKEEDFEKFITLMPKPMEGTLSDRLLNISLKIRAKTGTASNISSLVGYITTKNNRQYSFAIMIQGHTQPVKKIKQIEDLIVNEIYKLN